MRLHTDIQQEKVFREFHRPENIQRGVKLPPEVKYLKRRVGRSGASNPTVIESELFGQNVVFLSPNNTELLAHQGSSVTLSCRIDFGMVSTTQPYGRN